MRESNGLLLSSERRHTGLRRDGSTGECSSGLLERLARPLAVLEQRRVVGIALVRLDRRDDRAGGDKTGDVVNMPVRVVALDAVAEPSDPLDTKMVA